MSKSSSRRWWPKYSGGIIAAMLAGGASGVNVNGKIYAFGDQTETRSRGSFVNTVYEFDPKVEKWVEKTGIEIVGLTAKEIFGSRKRALPTPAGNLGAATR